MNSKEIVLGCEAKCTITGFKGIVTGIVYYISGCNQVLITGKSTNELWTDIQRVQRIGKKTIKLDNSKTPGADVSAPVR